MNTGPPGSLHDSAHFKSTKLYRKVEEGVMGGVPRRPHGVTGITPISPLNSGGSWVPSLELVHNTIQDGAHGRATIERGNMV